METSSPHAVLATAAMQLHPQFESDYSNPARFYKAVSLRHQKNPTFLPRLLRPRHSEKRVSPKLLKVDISNIYLNERGAFTLWLVSISTVVSVNQPSETVIAVLSRQDIPFKNGQYADKTVLLDTSCFDLNDVREWEMVLVITFNPNMHEDNLVSNGDAIAMKDIVRKLADEENVDMNQIHICCMDLPAISKSLKIKKKSISRKQSSLPRNWMSPVCSKRQRIILTTNSVMNTASRSISANIQIQWTSEPLNGNKVKDIDSCRNNDDNAEGGSSVRVKSSGIFPARDDSDCDKMKLIYYYMYTDQETQTVSGKREVKNSICCLWCNSNFGTVCNSMTILPSKSTKRAKSNASLKPLAKSVLASIKSLLVHLRNCHFHFEYHAMKDEADNIFIFMRRDRSHDIDQKALFQEKMKPYFWSKGFREDLGTPSSIFQDLPLMKVPGSTLSLQNGELEDGEKVEEKRDVMTRQYYHPRTGLPLVNEELGHESDEECVEWQNLALSNSAIDDFEDIGYEEKSFMKLWNSYITALPPYGDSYIPFSCEIFAKRFSVQLVDQHLRYHFLFHLITLWEFGLLRAEDIQYLISIVDKRVTEKRMEGESGVVGTTASV